MSQRRTRNVSATLSACPQRKGRRWRCYEFIVSSILFDYVSGLADLWSGSHNSFVQFNDTEVSVEQQLRLGSCWSGRLSELQNNTFRFTGLCFGNDPAVFIFASLLFSRERERERERETFSGNIAQLLKPKDSTSLQQNLITEMPLLLTGYVSQCSAQGCPAWRASGAVFQKAKWARAKY